MMEYESDIEESEIRGGSSNGSLNGGALPLTDDEDSD